MINKLKYERCTICQACINICPKECIKLDFFKEEFNYPIINKIKCIDCGACYKVCPVLNPLDSFNSLKVSYAGMNKNEEERIKSSSGGIFTSLAKIILEGNGAVCGAAFDNEFKVNHIIIEDENELGKLRGSKYVQSNINNIFKEIKVKLVNGSKVLFSGCPCQVAGLKKFLGKDYKNLYTLDFICHGIPSQNIFNNYIKLIEKKYKSCVTEFSFRDKTKGWHMSSIKVKFKNGNEYTKPIIEDMYMRGFLLNVYLKPSCYNCEFRNFKSGSDITLGDFWGAEVEEKEFDDDKGLSAIIINTKKGIDLKNKIESKVFLKKINYNTILKYNKAIETSFEPSPKRDRFLKLANLGDYQKIFIRLCREKKIYKFIKLNRKILRKIKSLIIKYY
ncbi:Coenzyme F420 hydrogenase/dehydrogenase, beta subunit C-terminal domain [Clostridium perfringens]